VVLLTHLSLFVAGHGRSVAVMCALLVMLKLAESYNDAEKLIKSVRPRARLNKSQRDSLQQWSKLDS
jgi:protein-tyrosine phosphatase